MTYKNYRGLAALAALATLGAPYNSPRTPYTLPSPITQAHTSLEHSPRMRGTTIMGGMTAPTPEFPCLSIEAGEINPEVLIKLREPPKDTRNYDFHMDHHVSRIFSYENSDGKQIPLVLAIASGPELRFKRSKGVPLEDLMSRPDKAVHFFYTPAGTALASADKAHLYEVIGSPRAEATHVMTDHQYRQFIAENYLPFLPPSHFSAVAQQEPLNLTFYLHNNGSVLSNRIQAWRDKRADYLMRKADSQ